MNVLYFDHITRRSARKHRRVLFVFGDNDARSGYGGLAGELRGEPNSAGIRVKKAPSMESNSFYTDDEYDENVQKIKEDIAAIFHREEYHVMVLSTAGIGTGLAQLHYHAPRTAKFLDDILKQHGISNGVKHK